MRVCFWYWNGMFQSDFSSWRRKVLFYLCEKPNLKLRGFLWFYFSGSGNEESSPQLSQALTRPTGRWNWFQVRKAAGRIRQLVLGSKLWGVLCCPHRVWFWLPPKKNQGPTLLYWKWSQNGEIVKAWFPLCKFFEIIFGKNFEEFLALLPGNFQGKLGFLKKGPCGKFVRCCFPKKKSIF